MPAFWEVMRVYPRPCRHSNTHPAGHAPAARMATRSKVRSDARQAFRHEGTKTVPLYPGAHCYSESGSIAANEHL